MTAYDRIVDHLRTNGAKITERSTGKANAQCPAHDDHNPSLSVTGIEGQALVYCHGGCPTTEVLAALNLTTRDLYDDPRGATYYYGDGRIVHRTPDKRFHQSGDTKNRPAQLYRADKVAEAVKAGRPVLVVEGEKDVHAAEAAGHVATCSPMGAGKWDKADPAPLHGGQILIVADQDEPGHRHATQILASLNGHADVAIFNPMVGKDLADHLAAGHTIGELVPARGAAVDPEPIRQAVLTRASTIRPERQRWLWTDRIPLGGLTLMAGREGLGKSTISNDIAAQITRGDLTGEFAGQPRDVLIVATEDNKATTIVPRLLAAGTDMDRVHFLTVDDDGLTGQPVFPLDTQLLGQSIEETKAALVILDAATSTIDGNLDGDRDRQMRQALEPLGRLGADHKCGILGIVHFGKRADSDTGKLILGSIAWSQVARSVIAVARDDDTGQLLIQPTKHNLAPGDTPALTARLVPHYVDTDDGPTSIGRVEWLGETDTRATDLLGRRDGDADDNQERDEARAWLQDYLARHHGEAPAKEVLKAGAADGHPSHVLKRAKRKARIGSRRVSTDESGSGHWVWTLTESETDFGPQTQGSAREPREQVHECVLPCDSCAPLGSGTPVPVTDSDPTRLFYPDGVTPLPAFYDGFDRPPEGNHCPTCGKEIPAHHKTCAECARTLIRTIKKEIAA